MRMRSSAQTGGLVAGAIGLGVLGYYGYPSLRRSLSGLSIVSVTFIPSPPVHGQPWSATVSVKAKAGDLVGAQGALVQTNGVVGGHLWASAADADAANNAYWNTYNATPGTAGAKSTAAEAAVAALSGRFDQRVATATADSSGTATIPLYSEALNAESVTLVVFTAVNPSGLIVPDSVGTTLATLKRAPVQQASFSVTIT